MPVQASVCQRGGEVLLSRQFVEMSSTRVHEILAVYPRLLQEGAKHTNIEEGGLRYIYEPLDELFVVLVSEAATANIIQDLKTLRLLSQLVKQTASASSDVVESKDVVNATFNIIDAFDEVITLGFSENLTASQVETFLRMESHEEKIQQIIERNKQLEAAEERKKKAKQLEAQRQAAAHSGLPDRFGSGMGSSSAGGFGSASSGFPSGVGASTGGFGAPAPVAATFTAPDAGGSSLTAGSGSALKGKGLKLGKKNTPISGGAGLPLLADPEPINTSLLGKPSGPGTAKTITPGSHLSAGHGRSSKSVSPIPAGNTTDITVSEQLTIEMTRDGQIKTSRVSGTLNLFAGDREHARLRIMTSTGGAASDYKPHPKMDRTLFGSDRVLSLKNSQEELPATNVLLVKWTVDNINVPITISCWVSDASDSGFLNVTLEYEVSAEFKGTLENIAVKIPLPTSNAHVSDPSSNFEQFDDSIVWMIPHASVTSESTGSFDFTAEAENEDDFYPLEVMFTTATQTGPDPLNTFGKIDVDAVIDPTNDEPVEFNKVASAQTSSFIVR